MAALDQPLAQRHSFRARECGADTKLLQEVSEFLAAQAQSIFLEHSPTGLDALAADEDHDSVGQYLGRIKLERLIARGGMGEVYAGTDELLQRPVAVKLMKSALRMSALRRSA
ncbi:MAG: hypothetical protein KDI60_14730, partial [Xanthomonadales bacterium]|nr:hypothetical protein [Xanthomonadales bacterium]